ncbi:MAG TPA: P-loop NTPase, partial [Nitrososphaerales archaeon]|nr:P-loop NTPase [Nitrososphaerales archaeon]
MVAEARIGYTRLSAQKRLGKIGKVILVGSGKGGVGKSLVACGLGLKLSEAGYRTGILDIDLHGASVPNYLGVRPPVSSGAGGVVPKESGKVKVMSVALFTGDNPVPVRGGGKEGLITDLFALTDWGSLDFLVVDLPPSTG